MSTLASVWSDIKESIFPSEAFADEPKQQGAETQENEEDRQAEDADAKDAGNTDSNGDDESESKDDAEDSGNGDEDAGDSGDAEAGEEDSGDGDDDEDEDDDDDEDDEDEEGVVDPLESLREKYTATVCKSFKHHFDECTERVTAAQQEEGYEDREDKEDCVEEFFHLEHCLNDHIAPVLFSKLR